VACGDEGGRVHVLALPSLALLRSH
jgi:hypothetical protein